MAPVGFAERQHLDRQPRDPSHRHTSYLTNQGCEGPEDAVTLTRIRALPTAA
jgi:hypothetical protein